jgi:cytochrome c nitrite reductase small subunit
MATGEGKRRLLRRVLPGLIIAGLVGVLLGAGMFTFQYGQGLSYLSTDPAACANCHIMNPHYDTWLKSSHQATATCADCHMPQRFPDALIAKMDNGWRHSWAFTFQNFHEPIQITRRNARILQDNCIRCHLELVDQMLGHAGWVDRGDVVSCVQCHAGVGHTLPPR